MGLHSRRCYRIRLRGHAGGAMSAVEIVRLAADQWAELKQLRIAALTESPDAFAPTAAQAHAHADDYWREFAQRAATRGNFAVFIVRRDGDAFGLVSAHRDRDGTGHIGMMWVDSRLRGGGVGARLFETAVAFLRDLGCASIELSVTEINAAAIALYESRGFALTGESRPLRTGSALLNLSMRWRLG